jgi:hypothetical protein
MTLIFFVAIHSLSSPQVGLTLQNIMLVDDANLVQPCSFAKNVTETTAREHKSILAMSEQEVERNLVLFVALGTATAIPTVHYNLMGHFAPHKNWDCILYVHKDEKIIPSSDARMKEISERCSVVRLPGLMWSHFLLTLTPELTRHFRHVAVILDDVFAPTDGTSSISVPHLLTLMKQYNLSTISPAIKGAYWSQTKPRQRPCLFQVHHLETFFQIMTRPLFDCWRSHMHYTNPQAFCLDLCLEKQLCPFYGKFAVDANMTAYHLGRQYMLHKFVPEEVLKGANLSYGMRRDLPKGLEDEWRVCHEYKCPTNESQIPTSIPLVCG